MGRWWWVVAGLSAPATVMAQVTLVGTVRNESGAPLPYARVELVRHKQAVTADAEGRFRFVVTKTGPQALAARAIGYRLGYRMMTLPARGEVRIDWALEQVPVHLPEIQVSAEVSAEDARLHSLRTRLRSYHYRGRILTRDDLARFGRNSLAVAVLPHLPGATITSLSEAGTWLRGPPELAGVGYPMDLPIDGQFLIDMTSPLPATYSVGATPEPSGHAGYSYGYATPTPWRWYLPQGPHTCSPAVSVNGGTPRPGLTVASFSADEVAAVEVYRQAPGGCGLVVVWT
ncbi:MAG: carboxypeptidase-like regulatory domain-containing protein [Gemmatimonadales bacterium]